MEPNSEDAMAMLAKSLRRIEDFLGLLPHALVGDARHRLARVRAIMLERRPPVLALIGRRGSGKSSLVNAFFGANVATIGHLRAQTAGGKYYDYTSERGVLTILDTRGMQEGSRPDGAPVRGSALDSLMNEVGKKCPDLLLFLVKASEIDAAIDADLDALEHIVREVERVHRRRPQILGIATHCDLLEPKGVALERAPGTEGSGSSEEREEKLNWVAAAERELVAKIKSRGSLAGQLSFVMGVASYLSFDAEGRIRSDERWRIGELASRAFEHLPEEAKATFARVAQVKRLQEDIAIDLTRVMAGLSSIVAATPVPVADLIPITSLQVSLVAIIAWLGGRSLDGKAASEFLAAMGVNVGAAFVFREGARALVKFVFPGAGSIVSGIVAFGGTMAIGAAAIRYFLHHAPIEEAKAAYDSERAKKHDDA
jgi:uncharacterized protein (DUF697 family)